MSYRLLIALGAAMLLTTSCQRKTATTAATVALPTLASRPSGPWRAGATFFKTGAYQIDFYGAATPPVTTSGPPWTGVITGDICLEAPDGRRIMVPNGSLIINRDGTFSTLGESRSYMIDPPAKP